MKTVELMIDESVFDNVLNFLALLPIDKIKIRVKDTDIPVIDDEEQQEIENILRKKSCYQAARSKVVSL